MLKIFSQNKNGFSLVEVIVALGLFSILAAGVFNVVTNSYRNFYSTGDKQSIAEYAQEAVEAVRSIRDNSWQTIEDTADAGGNNGLAKNSSGYWEFSGTSDTLGDLTRVVVISDVERDSNDEIVDSGGTDDPNTKKVTVTISGSGIDDYVLVTYITNWSYRSWEQTDWSGIGDREFWNDITMASSSVSNINTSTAGEIALTREVMTNGYTYRRSVVIDADYVDDGDTADLTDFPVFISETEDYFKSVANGGYIYNHKGYDIAFFSDSDGTVQLDHEIEKYDGDTGEYNAWVEVPTLDYNDDTTIYMFYSSSTISTSPEDVAGTWNSNYELVQHMNQGSGDILDSTSNSNDGTPEAITGSPYITVQRGSKTFTSGNLTEDVDLGTAVDTDYAYINVNFRGAGTTDDIEKIYVTAEFVDSDTIRFTRGESGTAITVAWEVIEADPDAPIPAFKVIQSSELTFGTSDTVKTDTVTGIGDHSNAVVFVQTRSNTGDDRTDVLVRGAIDGTTVTLTRAGTGISVTSRYWVVEFSEQFNVYKGSTTFTTDTNTSIGGTVDLGRAVVFVTWSETSNGLAQTSPREYLTTTNIYFDRDTATGTVVAEWAVVEFPSEVSVQSDNNTSSPATSGSSTTATVSSVTTANSFVVSTNQCTGTGTAYPRPITTTYLTNATTVTFQTSYTGQTNKWTYYLVDTSGWVYPTDGYAHYAEGKMGPGFGFDGTNDKLTITDDATLQPTTNDFSVSFWMKPSSSGTNYSAPIFKGNGDVNSQDGFLFRHMGHSTKKVLFHMGDGSISLGGMYTNSALNDDTWNHIALTVDRGTGYQFYVDGSTDNSCTSWPCYNSTSTVDGPDVKIGEDWSSTYKTYGTLDEIRYYSAAMSSAWLKTEYNNQYSTTTFYTIGNPNGYYTPGYLYSSIFDIGSSGQELSSISVEQNVPSDCQLNIDLQTADDKDFITYTSQNFDDVSTTYYTSTTPASLSSNRLLRYKVNMEACGEGNLNTPTLYSVKINYK